MLKKLFPQYYAVHTHKTVWEEEILCFFAKIFKVLFLNIIGEAENKKSSIRKEGEDIVERVDKKLWQGEGVSWENINLEKNWEHRHCLAGTVIRYVIGWFLMNNYQMDEMIGECENLKRKTDMLCGEFDIEAEKRRSEGSI